LTYLFTYTIYLSVLGFKASPSLHIHTPLFFQVGLEKDGWD